MTTKDRITNIIANATQAGLRVEDRTFDDGIRLVDIIWDVDPTGFNRTCSCERMIWIRTGNVARTVVRDYFAPCGEEFPRSLAFVEEMMEEAA